MFNLNHFQPNPPPIKTKVDLDELDLFEYLSKNVKYLNFNFNNKRILDIFIRSYSELERQMWGKTVRNKL